MTTAYIRVSKESQDPTTQRTVIEKWAAAHKIKITEWIEESGSRDMAHKRLGFQRLLKLTGTTILVAERDRFGASDMWEYGSFIHRLRMNRCRLLCCADNKELTSTDDRVEPFMATITSERSRSEQEARGQRTHRDKYARIQRGLWGGGKTPYGYDLVCRDGKGQELWRLVYEPGRFKRLCHYPDGSTRRFDGKDVVPGRSKGELLYAEPTLDKAVIATVKRLFKMFADGHSYRGIANHLNALKIPALYRGTWVGSAIAAIIRNPMYHTGVPVWNKSGGGRFVEFVDGEFRPVERVGGRVPVGRKRSASDHITSAHRPDLALISTELWNQAQARRQRLATQPKSERRVRNPNLYLSGLIVCGGCGDAMGAWGARMAYRCTRNMYDSRQCRCNTTRHEVVEQYLVKYLAETGQKLSVLTANPDWCYEAWQLEQQTEPVQREFIRRFTQAWRDGKTVEATTPKADHGGRILALERERDKLVRRLGLVSEAAAHPIAARIEQITLDIQHLRGSAKPGPLEALRLRLLELQYQTAQTQVEYAQMLPSKKKEAVRGLVSQIVVHHEQVMVGKCRGSRLVRIDVTGGNMPRIC